MHGAIAQIGAPQDTLRVPRTFFPAHIVKTEITCRYKGDNGMASQAEVIR